MVGMRGNAAASAGISIAQLETADRQALAGHFEAVFGVVVDPRASLAFLRGNLAWALQARQQGLDPVALRKRLTRQLSVAVNANPRQQSDYRAGTRLVREWQGVVHEVTVVDDGYAWQGRVYRSLSPIASAITGTRWSGPRFFGLRKAPPP